MSDDYPVTHSPLECEITRDGITVEICIYRGEEDPGWLLEVVDEEGGSTIWEDHLATDQEALDLAMKTIEEEGIATFSKGMSNGGSESRGAHQNRVAFMEPLPLDDDELTELKTLLGDRSLASVVGMLAAVVSVPEVLPSQLWLGEVMRGIEVKNAEQATPFIDFIMRLNNHVATAFVDGDPMRICPSDGDGIDDDAANAEFCTGYLSIVRAAGVEPKDDELLELLERIAEGKEDAWGMTHDFDAVLGLLYARWHRRTVVARQSPKVRRNDPCHCGSGKKFKRCHGAPS